ncbi:MAG TPA: ATP-binding cassette domain-containing protein [Aliiroseovarius sp.]|nr:ATP-binding cassette domain-containing protein [Aliiroseovarius sp.]
MLEVDKGIIQQGDFRLSAGFQVRAGAIVAVLGPSGAGKSTLLAAIAGFVPLSEGRILWQGRDITTLPPAARPVSVLFQDGNLFPHMNARDNVALGIDPGLRLSATQWGQVDAALKRVGLDRLGARKPAELSGGQIARVALARAVLRDRPVMLLDEPFSALGPGLKADMLALVHEIASDTGATVLMVSHDPGDARAIASEVILVADGRAQPPRQTGAIFDDPPDALRAYLG